MSAPEKRVERLFIGNGVADTAARVWSGGVVPRDEGAL